MSAVRRSGIVALIEDVYCPVDVRLAVPCQLNTREHARPVHEETMDNPKEQWN